MRLIAGFVGVCLLLAGTFAWLTRDALRPPLRSQQPAESAAPSAAAAETGRRAAADEHELHSAAPEAAARAPLRRAACASSAPIPPASAARDPTAQVIWADDETSRRARQRLAAATNTLRADASHPAALRDAADALQALERWDAAADVLTRLLEVQDPPEDATRARLATALLRAQRWSAAVAQLECLAHSAPTDARVWFNLAVARQALGRLQAAAEAWKTAISLEPASAESHARLGEVLLDLHAWPEAAAALETALRLTPDDGAACANLALAYARLQRFADAQRLLKQRLVTHASDRAALIRMAQVCSEQYLGGYTQDGSTARHWCERALAADPQNAELRRLLAELAD